MSYQIVNLDSSPNQSFQATLNVDEKNLTLGFNVWYNEVGHCWLMRISNPEDDSIYIDGVPLICGDFPSGNLLEQHAHMAIGSAFIFNVTNVPGDRPTSSNLGTDYKLLWGDTI